MLYIYNMKKSKVSVIVPTFNEEKSIVNVITEIKKLKEHYDIEIIVGDGGSLDKTVNLAKKQNVIVLTFPHNRGKGIDFWESAQKATGEYVVQIDADNQFNPLEIPLLIKALQKGADVAIARRIDHSKAPIVRTIGNYIFSSVTSFVVQKELHDIVAGFKAFRRNALLSLDLQDRHFGYEGEIVVKSIRKGFKLVEVPVSYKPRVTGKSQVFPLRDGFLTLYSIFKARIMPLS
jgi:glycosyltransferase involved in cell wall biosynthesis